MDYDTLHVVYSYPTMRIDPSYSTYLMYSDFDNIYFSDNTIAYTKDITVSAPFTVSYTPELSENMTSNLYDSSGNMLATKNNKITANVSLSPEFLNATDDLSDTMPDYANSTYAIVAFISKSQITVDSKFPDCYNDGVLFATTKSNYYVGDDINFGVSCIQYIPRNDVLTIEFDLSQIDYYSHGISEDDPLYVNFVGLFVKQAYTSSEYLNTQLSLGNLTDITNFKNIAYPYLATSLYSYGYTSSLDEESLRKFVIQENLPSNISDELKTFILELVGGGSASALLNLFTGNKNSNDTDYDFTASSIDEYLSNFSTDNIVEDSTQLLLKYYSTYCISDKFCYSDETDETVKYPSYDESISTKGGNSVTLSVNTGKNVTNNDNKTITIGDKTYNYTYNPSTSTFDEITNVYPEKQTNETLIATYYNNNYSNTTVVSPSDSSSSSDNSSSSETVSGSGSTTIINNVVYNYDYSSSYETPEDYQQTVNNTEINKNLGTFDFDVTDISGIFDGTSDFFKFLTAGINILPSYFLTILVAFFVIMLAIVVIKWIL
jgi:hypothetical protein